MVAEFVRRARRATDLKGKNDRRQPPSPDGSRLLFVGGAPRSGTTLLQHILDSHPDVFGGPEFDCIPAIMRAWRSVVAALEQGRIAVFCSRAQIDTSFATMIESLLLPAADAHGSRLLSEKTPFNVLVLSDLLELFPKCRAIHVVRDPRGVVASMLKVADRIRAKNAPAPDFVQDVRSAAEFTTASLNAGFHAEGAFPGRVLTLTYETLVREPEPAIKRACAFLDIPFYPEMLQPHSKKHPAEDAIQRLDDGRWLDPALGSRPIEVSRVAVWQQELDAAQIDHVNAAFRDHPGLRALGYRFA